MRFFRADTETFFFVYPNEMSDDISGQSTHKGEIYIALDFVKQESTTFGRWLTRYDWILTILPNGGLGWLPVGSSSREDYPLSTEIEK